MRKKKSIGPLPLLLVATGLAAPAFGVFRYRERWLDLTMVNHARRDSLYRETWPIFRRDLPFTFLAPQVQLFVTHRRVRGLESLFRAHPYMAAADMWIEEDEP